MLRRLRQIDKLNRADHAYLTDEDECHFYGDYTSRRGYRYSDTNDLISNFKKSPQRRGERQWTHKEQAIAQIARVLGPFCRQELRSATLVPIPPSRCLDDPLYDDRMEQVLALIDPSADIRILIQNRRSMVPDHRSEVRATIKELIANYKIDEARVDPAPVTIALFDDVITTGRHFRAAKTVLQERFPTARIIGVFVARRVFPDE